MLEIASLKKKLAELQEVNERLEQEAKTQEEETNQLNQEIYRLNEKLLIKEHGGGVDQSQQEQLGGGTVAHGESLNNLGIGYHALDAFFAMKDANVKRSAAVGKLKQKLEALHGDLQVYQLSKKLKLQDVTQRKALEDSSDLKEPKSLEEPEVADLSAENPPSPMVKAEISIDSDQMINEQVEDTLALIRSIDSQLRQELQALALTGARQQVGILGKSTMKVLRARRKSMGNYTVSWLAQMTARSIGEQPNQQNMLNDSDLDLDKKTHAQQLMSLP